MRAQATPEAPSDAPQAASALARASEAGIAPVPEAPDDVLSALNGREIAFVLAAADGMSWTQARAKAGWRDDRTIAAVLARPHVRQALQRVSLGDPKNAARLLAPYAVERLVRIAVDGGDAQAIHAARDILALAGLGPVSRSEHVTASAGDIARMLAERAGAIDVSPRDDRQTDKRRGKRATPAKASDARVDQAQPPTSDDGESV